MGPRLHRISQLCHFNHPEDDIPCHHGSLYCNGSIVREMHDVGLILSREGNDIIPFIFGVNELKNTDNFIIMRLKRKSKD